MGDRGNIAVRQNRKRDGDKPRFVYLYSHWGGTELPQVLQNAMKRGEDRLDDGQYAARIIFCEMMKGDSSPLNETTGYGISDHLCDNEHPILVFDPDGTVEVYKEGDEVDWKYGPVWEGTHDEYMALDLSKGWTALVPA